MTAHRSRLNRTRAAALVLSLTAMGSLVGCSGDSKDAGAPSADEKAVCDAYAGVLRAQQRFAVKPKDGAAELKAAATKVADLKRPESLSEPAFEYLQAQAELYADGDPMSAKGQKAFQEKLTKLGPEATMDLGTFSADKCSAQLEELQQEVPSGLPTPTMAASAPAKN